jgi:hypothetical protein
MASFDDREKSFENKFKHDEELRFKVTNRRNKLLGLWAAELLGKSGDDAEAYARDVVASDFDKPGDEDVYEKVMGDLQGAGADVDEHKLRKTMETLLQTAKEQIASE